MGGRPGRGQKTGLFLDQRENRLAAAAYSRGEVLDAFAYQGAFAMHLAPGARAGHPGGELRRGPGPGPGKRRLNGFDNLELVKDNVFNFLKEAVAAGPAIRFHCPGPAGLCQEPPGPGRGVQRL